MKKNDKYDPNWAEKLILKKTKDLINKESEEKEFQNGDYYNLSDMEFKRLLVLAGKESRKMDMLQNMIIKTDDIKERLRILETLEVIVAEFWKSFYEMFPNLNDYHITMELQDRRIKIIRKKFKEEM